VFYAFRFLIHLFIHEAYITIYSYSAPFYFTTFSCYFSVNKVVYIKSEH